MGGLCLVCVRGFACSLHLQKMLLIHPWNERVNVGSTGPTVTLTMKEYD